MLIRELLEDLDLGSDAAENDSVLERAFVQTTVFSRLVADKIDLVTGLKGTGKSALYRRLTEQAHTYAELSDVDVVRAVNPTGGPIFQSLFEEDSSEARLRAIWAAYIAALLGNEVVRRFRKSDISGRAVKDVVEILELLGVLEVNVKPRSLLQKIKEAATFEPSMTTDASGTTTFSLKFDVAGSAQPRNPVSLEVADFIALIATCDGILRAEGRRLWIAIDRLDECFTRDSAVERRALRALLRTHLDVVSSLGLDRRFGLKIFLRTDLMRRMTHDSAFTNSTHLRSAELQWGNREIQSIVGRRLLASARFREAWPDCDLSQSPEKSAWEKIMPRQLSGPEDMNGLQKICEWTCDAHRGFNPRNVVALLQMALDRVNEADSAGTAPKVLDTETPLLREADITSSLGKLSRKRLTDTVLNEFPATHPLVSALERKPNTYDHRDALLEALGLAAASRTEQDAAIEVLVLSGVIGVNGGRYIIPRLYRAAIRAPRAARRSGRSARRDSDPSPSVAASS
ncbi:hypothetical protein CTKZ_05240 [Cellulomonas algicola]|uniref:Uncharacterized protein n=1 Tax=Cellulomonas algicola TaxID=2071633 RepID=A0A401UWH2_9CELL|nr:hypothetical protein [Cellulomonas algicola]GCD18962.1 hypothetical protein CTKZ_05240 [Cellulomonas algicola]